MNKGKLKHYAHYWCRNAHCSERVSVSKSVLEADFVEHLQALRPDEATVAQFPAIAAAVWVRRHADRVAVLEDLKKKLKEHERLKMELLRAKLRGEVNQANYVQANSAFDCETAVITHKLDVARSETGTVNAFLRFSMLMLVDIATAWQQTPIEQRVRVQNFLFHDGIAYKKSEKFLNTSNATLFQQLRDLTPCKGGDGVPNNKIFEHLEATIADATPLYELCASVLNSAP